MKNTAVIAVLCLAIGFSTAWFVKPAPEVASSSQEADSERKNRKSNRSSSASETAQSTREARAKMMEVYNDDESAEMKEMRKKSRDREKERAEAVVKKKFDARISAIVRELGLNAAQEKELRGFFDKQLAKLDAGDLDDFINDPAKTKKMAAAMRGEGLRDHMKGLLSEEQVAKLDAMDARKHKNKVEGRAMKGLAQLQQSMDLTDDQKDAVYGVLLKDAESGVENQSDLDFLMRSYMEGMGVGIDMGDDDLGAMMKLQSLDDGADPMAAIKELYHLNS